MNKNVIELNGKLYDATSGALIGSAASKSRKIPLTVQSSTPDTQHAQPADRNRDHHLAQPKPHKRKPETPKTLMRRVVAKPTAETKPAVKQQYPITVQGKSVLVSAKKSAGHVDDIRLKRAQTVHKSTAVNRFSQNAHSSSHTKTAIPVRISKLDVKPAPAPAHIQQTATPSAAAAKVNLFEKALVDAKSHEELPHTPAKRRGGKRFFRRGLVNASAGILAVLLIGGFVAYMNKAAIQLELASVRAGFQATMPGYAPTGFTAEPAVAEPGKVTISFLSPDSSKSFALTQQSSNWDSQDLFDDIAQKHETAYQTIQSNGRTIYLYGNNEAAWVDGGILYTVSGNAALEGNQLISLATSL